MSKSIKEIFSKSKVAKMARHGKDLGKKGKNFNKIASKAGKQYGSKEAGAKVAGSILQRMRASGKL